MEHNIDKLIEKLEELKTKKYNKETEYFLSNKINSFTVNLDKLLLSNDTEDIETQKWMQTMNEEQKFIDKMLVDFMPLFSMYVLNKSAL
jgi:23S rRNA maturation-related 3'-5' exoribonuclease YhaM